MPTWNFGADISGCHRHYIASIDNDRYKELGAEKGGHDHGEGVRWGETWKERYYTGEDGLEHIEKSAEKWTVYGTAPHVVHRNWSEHWNEHYNSAGDYVKSVEKNGSMDDGRQSWTERWGESHTGGKFHNWTDKWANNVNIGARWGDKWDEDFDRYDDPCDDFSCAPDAISGSIR